MLHQTLSFVLILASCVAAHPPAQRAAKPKSKVQVVGDFVRISLPGDDAFGYSLELWQEGDHIFGLLEVYVGPPADSPAGLLEDVSFDRRTGRFSFSARLSTGVASGPGNKMVPTRERFTFKGTLTRRQVTGALRQVDVLRPDLPAVVRRIKLRFSKRRTEDLMPAPASYDDWRKWADDILRRRGPQW